MNRIDRLFGILLVLQRHRRIRAQDLATQFEVSERTIYRDMRALNELGVPVVATAGEGYQLLETFSLPPLALNEGEAKSAFLALHMFLANSAGAVRRDAENLLRKIGGVLPPALRTEVEALAALVDFYPAEHPLIWDDPSLRLILQAIRTQHIIRFSYRGYQQTELTRRDVEPGQLSFHDGAWYLNGFCRLRNDTRNFRLSRIYDLEQLSETFTPRMVYPPKATYTPVLIRFADEVYPHVRERQHYAFFEEIDDQTCEYHVDDLREIRGWVLGFGSAAEVIRPEALREWIRQEAESLIKLLT